MILHAVARYTASHAVLASLSKERTKIFLRSYLGVRKTDQQHVAHICLNCDRIENKFDCPTEISHNLDTDSVTDRNVLC